ncbi:PHO85 cyclin CLG1 [Yarrowia sp. B02]|nr:PHO85 cyclin CLG1 [Yarrowia sp. B02]
MAFQYPYSHHHMAQAPMDQGYFHQAPQAPSHFSSYDYDMTRDMGYDMTRGYPYTMGYPPQVVPPPIQMPAPQPAVTGGVSATLDYEIKDMAEFLTSMALGIMKPNSEVAHDAFKAFASQVLSATRLPRATVVLSLVYLSKRWAMKDLELGHEKSSGYIYRMSVVSLLLANKFHDDNTFTNRSWSQATGIAVGELTSLEADWLQKIAWSLHLDQQDLKGWHRWNDCWNYWVANSPKSSAASSPLVSVSASEVSTTNTSPHASSPVSPVSLSKPKVGSVVMSSPTRPFYTVPSWYNQGSTSVCAPQHHPHAPATFTSYFQQSFASVGPPVQPPMQAPSIPPVHHQLPPQVMPMPPPHAYPECKEGPIASYYNPVCDCAHCVFDPFPKHVVAC